MSQTLQKINGGSIHFQHPVYLSSVSIVGVEGIWENNKIGNQPEWAEACEEAGVVNN